MKKHILYCNPKDGKFNWEKIFDLKNLPGKLEKYSRVKVTFEKFVPMKTNNQLAYYHAGILLFLEKTLHDDTGLSKNEWHAELKNRFGLKKQDKSGTFEVLVSHADYNEKEMSFFITQVINWVRDFFNVEIPPPTVIDEYL